jgi:uncharacterized OsmC-like protein
MRYKLLVTICAVLLMALLIVINYNVNLTTSYVIFQGAAAEAKIGALSPDNILLIGILACVALVVVAYVVLKEKDLL